MRRSQMYGLDYSRRNNQFQVDYDYVISEEHVWYILMIDIIIPIGVL